jgi:hypothetical protein
VGHLHIATAHFLHRGVQMHVNAMLVSRSRV